MKKLLFAGVLLLGMTGAAYAGKPPHHHPIPEPSSFALFSILAAGAFAVHRFKRSTNK